MSMCGGWARVRARECVGLLALIENACFSKEICHLSYTCGIQERNQISCADYTLIGRLLSGTLLDHRWCNMISQIV